MRAMLPGICRVTPGICRVKSGAVTGIGAGGFVLRALLVTLALGGLPGCSSSEPVNCLSDVECPSNTYCKALSCVTPSAEGALEDVYRDRIAPLLATGCNCHGPESGRPWSFDHRSLDGATFEASLSLLRNWMYNPYYERRSGPDGGVADGGVPVDRFALVGYAQAECGYRHPQIWPPGAAQLRELELYFERAYAVIPRPAGAMPPTASAPEAALSGLEGALFEQLTALAGEGSFERALATFHDDDADLERRLATQCGCCHDSTRSFIVPTIDLQASPAAAVARREAFLCEQAAGFPGRMIYALGLPVGPVQHPLVYLNADDGRYALLYRWFEMLAERTPVDAFGDRLPLTAVPPCGEPAPPPDLGVDSDAEAPDRDPTITTALTAYQETFGPMLAERCGSAAGCHQVMTNRWYHRWPLPPGDDGRSNIGRMEPYLDRDQPASSLLIARGEGVQHPFSADGFGGDRAGLIEWIGALPPGL